MERLVEILNWMGPEEEEIRRAAAIIVSKLAGKKQNALRVSGDSWGHGSIASLLYTGHESNATRPEEISHKQDPRHRGVTITSPSTSLACRFSKKLANDHEIAERSATPEPPPQDNRSHRPLPQSPLPEVSRRRHSGGEASAPGRQDARRNHLPQWPAASAGDLRERLHGEQHPRHTSAWWEEDRPLQRLGVEILTCLAMDAEARERIGATGE
ncbi:hypothetical protein HPP92_010965 [Vanilla planifolia]|uniref:Uncharacterized protein n=1 Tax=Vanilla planifolia TaxID=51239 RepID=A0A835R549_VANPL|nr:hypothetical protein HPP92_010965 [Vanilla planifolia]